nr:EOG090X0AX4 [Macrothrix elegans]
MDSSETNVISCTCVAPINIAVIKYWGKSDEEQVIPLNDSLSVTLDTDCIYTKTTVKTSADLFQDTIVINNEKASADNLRFRNCLMEVRKLASRSKNPISVERSKWKVSIISENNFPTKAGLASSASGYACLVYTLAQLYEIDATSSELSAIARRGSGSACRSLFGGFVRWYHQKDPCIAEPIASADHWPELCCIIAVVSSSFKSVGSTEGMRRSVDTSSLLQHRAKHVVPNRIQEMQQAIVERNFPRFGELTMRDSNQFHAICLDTHPPLFYLNNTSQAIIQLVHSYNEYRQEIAVAYTFDAGPNAVLFMKENELHRFAAIFHHSFSITPSCEFYRGKFSPERIVLDSELESIVLDQSCRGKVKYAIVSRVGHGPRNIDPTG